MDDKQAIRPSWPAIIVISVIFLVYVWDRVVVPVEAVEIRTSLSLSLPSIGLLGSVFTFGLVLSAIPAGFFAGRFGTRASLVVGAAVFSLGTLGFGLSDGLGLLVAMRIFSGIGEGLYNVALLTFLGRMTRKYRSLAVGFPATLFGLGVFTGPAVILPLQHVTGVWWQPFLILGAAGLAGAFLLRFLLPGDRPTSQEDTPKFTLARVGSVLTPGTIAIYCAVAATGVIVYSYLSLLQGYLRSESGLSPAISATIFSLFGAGTAIGGVGMGVVGDLVGRGRFISLGAVLVAAIGAVVFWVPPSLFVSGVLSLLIGAGTNGIYVNCIALAQDRSGHANIPIATGMLAVIYYFMSAFSGYFVGLLTLHVGWEMTGVLAYAVPYLVIAPFLFRLIWRPLAPEMAQPGLTRSTPRP